MMRRNTEHCEEQRQFQCVQCNSKMVLARQPESRQTQAPSRHITTASRLRKPFRHTIWPLQRQIQLQRHPKEGKPPKTQSSTIKPRPITQGARPPTAATILPTSPLGAATSSPNRRQHVGRIPPARSQFVTQPLSHHPAILCHHRGQPNADADANAPRQPVRHRLRL